VRGEEHIIYGTKRCVFCERSKTLIEHHGYKWIFMDVEESPEIQEKFFKKFQNVNSVPQIAYYDPVRSYGNENMEVVIGNFEALSDWLKKKKIDK